MGCKLAKFVIRGGNKLHGTALVKSAKNAVVACLAGAVLGGDEVVLHNCPDIKDCDNMVKILTVLGCKVHREGSTLTVDPRTVCRHEIPSALASELRSSIFLLGPILGKLKVARVAYPGGCEIGLRPIDLHLDGLRALNVKIEEGNGYINCDASAMKGAHVHLELPSVGATENVMMAATMADGDTVIHNPAKEPEIVDLQDLLVKMGADVQGAGTGKIYVRGNTRFHGAEHTPIPDRIVAGTYVIATAMCGGEVEILGAEPTHIEALLSKIRQYACKITAESGKIVVSATARPYSRELIETMPYPGFPTDLQAPMTALCAVSRGTSIVVENMFETRFKHVPELVKMGAKIIVRGKNAVIVGVKSLTGAEVYARDLRGGAALTLAGLYAHGVTVVNGLKFIDRGYEDLATVFGSLGADIVRTD